MIRFRQEYGSEGIVGQSLRCVGMKLQQFCMGFVMRRFLIVGEMSFWTRQKREEVLKP